MKNSIISSNYFSKTRQILHTVSTLANLKQAIFLLLLYMKKFIVFPFLRFNLLKLENFCSVEILLKIKGKFTNCCFCVYFHFHMLLMNLIKQKSVVFNLLSLSLYLVQECEAYCLMLLVCLLSIHHHQVFLNTSEKENHKINKLQNVNIPITAELNPLLI